MNTRVSNRVSGRASVRRAVRIACIGALLSVLIAVTACSQIIEPHFVALELPSPPEAWHGLLAYRQYEVCWYNAQVRPVCRTVPIGETPLLDFPRLLQSPVLVTPMGVAGLRLPPAGALYPASIGAQGRLTARWEDGSAMALLYPLVPRLQGVATFNAQRFAREVWHRTDGQPWELDRERVLTAFTNGRLTATNIARRAAYPVVVELPPGEWRPVNPFGVPVITGADGTTDFGELGVGNHWFIEFHELSTHADSLSTARSQARLGLQVAADGRITTIITEY